jgi:integrase
MTAWLFQNSRQRQQFGGKAPWSVGWRAPDGKQCSKRIGSKSLAEKFKRRLENELAAGTYNSHGRLTWAEFRTEYESKVMEGASASTAKETRMALNRFEKLVKPVRLVGIDSKLIDTYIARRRKQKGRTRAGEETAQKISVATVNKELRHIKLVLNRAVKWGYLPKLPDFEMQREPVKLKRFVEPNTFTAIYDNCNAVERPGDLPFEPAVWWEGMLLFAYCTGWRIGEILALRREDLNLDAGRAITRHSDNKGNRDDAVPLAGPVVEHLRRLACFEPVAFPWYYGERTLYRDFHRIQEAAGIPKPYYGFHDLRRGFASMNAGQMSATELQALMRHRSFETTKRYINQAQQLTRTAEKVFVPDVGRKAVGG